MNSTILYLTYFLEINWVNIIFVGLPLCSRSCGWEREIIKLRKKIPLGYKETIEAELSYLTQNFGFVNDEYIQHSGTYMDPRTDKRLYLNPVENILHVFVERYVRGNEAYDTRITRKYFEDKNLQERLCPTYLADPIFQYNGIILIQDHEEHPSLYELKFAEFQYFTRKNEFVEVIKCPVVVDGFVTFIYFLEIHHYWRFSGPRSGYFVFFNKVVPNGATRQPLQLLMFVAPDSSFPEMDTEGEEAEVHNELDSVTKRAINIRLRLTPGEPTIPKTEWTAKILMKHMKNAGEGYTYFFGEEAEIMFLAKTYGFIDILVHRARPWRMKRILSILDHMGKDYLINRKRMKDVKEVGPIKSCLSYIFMNDELKNRKIVPQRQLQGAAYVYKIVNFRQFEYEGRGRPRELLRCPVTCGERKRPRNMYLLPIHYENPAKSPQVFTFFENREDPNKVNVYTLSPVPFNVDTVDYSRMDENLIDPGETSTASDLRRSQTISDSETSNTVTTDLSTVSFPTDSQYSDTISLLTGSGYSGTPTLPSYSVDADLASLTTGPEYADTTLLTGPVDSDTVSLTSGPVDSDIDASITGPAFSRSDSLPQYPIVIQGR